MEEKNLTNTALLVMDMQQGILGTYPGAMTLLANATKAIVYARSKQIPCCTDPDSEVHQLLMTKIFSKRADIITVEEWCSTLTKV
jgi:nicotinamidase-related amidase